MNFPVGSEHGLLLMGPCGVGKTHLAVSAMKSIVLRGHSGLFYDYRELLKAIQDSYNPESQATEMSVLEPVLKTEILVLDDVGSSKPSLWALETVGHVLNTRYNEKRVTLLTTNFLDSDAGGGSVSNWRARCARRRDARAHHRRLAHRARRQAHSFAPIRDVPHRRNFRGGLPQRNSPRGPIPLMNIATPERAVRL